jgi:exodeoxyribonuclease VII small subunit
VGKADEDISFEKAMKQLEEVVASLETGSLGLEESLGAFEKGMSLVRICQMMLKDAEVRIEKLVETKDGMIITEPFHIGDEP